MWTLVTESKKLYVSCTLSVIVSLCAVRNSAAGNVAPPDPNDLTLGRWELEVNKSHFCPAASGAPTTPPVESARDIFDAGGGLISTNLAATQANGKRTDTWFVYRYDGKLYPSSITKPSTEGIVWQLLNPHQVTFQHVSYKDGRVTRRLVRNVSDGGQMMTQTTHDEGRPQCDDVEVFRREPLVFP